jgi:hypothetical protein
VTYTCLLEKAGIPCVNLGFPDQINFEKNVALVGGVPNIRWVDSPRTGTGEERVNVVYDKVIEALTAPLTAKEKESGLYTPPPPPRILFSGTLDDAQEFYQQTTPIANCRDCPIAKYTDGLPIIIPTEEKVKEMLTGTSHSPDEEIYRYTKDATTGELKKATSVVLYAKAYKTTVEKVATVAVMAGCKPEYLPACLAVATSGGASTSCPGTSGPYGYWFCVSGPYAKEIGMNAGQNAMDVGNPANVSIGRSASLMTVDFGGCIAGAVRTDLGSLINGVAFAEDVDGMPPGWEGLNEEGGYKTTESIIGKYGAPDFWGLEEFGAAPSSFRGFIGSGYGGMAKYLGVEGIPGPHNFLAYVMPKIQPFHIGGVCMVMHPNMAISLYDYGFKKKADVYKWLYDTFFTTEDEWSKMGWYDHQTNEGKNIDPVSGKAYKDLPPDYQLHTFGYRSANENCLIVSNGFADEICWVFGAAASEGGRPTLYPIDVWR